MALEIKEALPTPLRVWPETGESGQFVYVHGKNLTKSLVWEIDWGYTRQKVKAPAFYSPEQVGIQLPTECSGIVQIRCSASISVIYLVVAVTGTPVIERVSPQANRWVYLTGQQFCRGCSVLFQPAEKEKEQEVPASVYSSTQIGFSLPAGSSDFSVRVKNKSGVLSTAAPCSFPA